MSVVRMRRVGAKGEDDMGEKRNRLGIEDLVRFRIRPNALNDNLKLLSHVLSSGNRTREKAKS